MTVGLDIKAIAVAVPKRVVRNSDLSPESGADAAAKITGVLERRIAAPNKTVLHYAIEASLALKIKDRQADIDALIFATQSPELRLPGPADQLHHILGLRRDVMAISLNASCSGWVQALLLAESLLNSDAGMQNVLVVAGDLLNNIIDPLDKATAPVFGDAVSATLVGLSREMINGPRVVGTVGSGFESLFCFPNDYLHMDGVAVFDFAVSAVPQVIKELADEGPDYYCLHQANAFMLKAIARRAGLSMEQVPINIERWGNTSSASIPLLLCDPQVPMHALLMQETLRLALIGYGAGFAYAGTVLDVGPLAVCDIVEVAP